MENMACSRMGMVVSIHIQRSGCDSCDSQLFSVYRMVRTRLGLHVSVLMSSINNEPSRVHDARNVSMAMFPCDDGSDVRNTVTQSTKRGLPFFPREKPLPRIVKLGCIMRCIKFSKLTKIRLNEGSTSFS